MLIGWCGMRGLVTLATAFALPADFPQRDLIVLTAFAVVLATLVVQGLTLGAAGAAARARRRRRRRRASSPPAGPSSPRPRSRRSKAGRAPPPSIGAIRSRPPAPPRTRPATRRAATPSARSASPRSAASANGSRSCARQRQVGPEAFLILQEELDFLEVTLSDEDRRRIEPS